MKKKNVFAALSVFTLIVLLLGACASPVKLMENGNYDQAIDLAIKKLRGKKKKKAKHVRALETAFSKATINDMRLARDMKAENRDENWTKINKIHQQIRRRQSKIEPLLPLYDDNGKKAEFRFVKIEDLERESKKKSVEYYYAQAQELLRDAERGDKMAAREAYDNLKKIEQHYKDYRDKDRLVAIAQELGTTHILFEMKNQARAILPRDFERELKRMSVGDLDNRWKTFHTNTESGIKYDYTIRMNINKIDVSPDRIKEREYIDDKEIEEGYEYVLDANGNVMKDTAGNDIKVPKKIFIKARVFETFQSKAAIVGGRLEFVDNRTKDLLKSEPISVEAVFENYASTFDGDKRALTEDSKRRIGNRPVSFPSDETLLLDAAEKMKPVIKRMIERSRLIQ